MKMNKLVLPATLLSMLLLAGCGNSNAKAPANSQKDSSSKVVSSKKESQQNAQPSQSSSSSSVSATSSSTSSQTASGDSNTVKQFVMGQTFTIQPVLYNGEPVDKAMDEQKAPQNIVHDYTVSVTFDNPAKATVKFIGAVRPDHSAYTISNGKLTVEKYNIPYTVNGKSVTFLPWKASDGQGGTITYKLVNQ